MKLIVMITTIVLFHGCTLFEKDEKLLTEYQKSDGQKIKIYYVALGATTSDVIQVRKANENKAIWVSDKYNYIESSKLLNDSVLQLCVNDTGNHNNRNKIDTIIIDVR